MNRRMHERFQAADRVHDRRFDDEVVLLHLVAGKYFSLDDVGAEIWAQLKEGQTPDAVVASLLAKYEVNEATARADVERIVDELLRTGLLERRE